MAAVRHFFLEIYTIIYKKTEENNKKKQTQRRHAHTITHNIHIHAHIQTCKVRSHNTTYIHTEMITEMR